MATVHVGYSRVHTMRALLTAAIVVAGLQLTAACGDACTDLARKICRCERTQNDQNACISRVTSDTSVGSATDDEIRECRRLNDTCNCTELAEGRIWSCGLAKTPPGQE